MENATEQKEMFTAGEWGVFFAMDGRYYITSDTNDVAVMEPVYPFESIKANAALIAESKNMYYALQEVLGMCEYPYKDMATYKAAKEILNRINKANAPSN